MIFYELFFLFQSASQKTYNRMTEPGNESAVYAACFALFISFCIFSYVFQFVLSFDCVFTSAQIIQLTNKIKLKSTVKRQNNKSPEVSLDYLLLQMLL